MRRTVFLVLLCPLFGCNSVHQNVSTQLTTSIPSKITWAEHLVDAGFRGEIMAIRPLRDEDDAVPVGKDRKFAVEINVHTIRSGTTPFRAGEKVIFAVSDSSEFAYFLGKQIGFSLTSIDGNFIWLTPWGC